MKRFLYIIPVMVCGLLLGALPSWGQVSTFPFTYDVESESTCGTTWNSSCLLGGPFTNDTGDDQDWLVDVGGTSSSSTGPSVDHTLGTSAGKYLYFESSASSVQGYIANLVSPVFDFTNAPAPELRFWYHMYGQSMGTMHVDVNTGTGWVLDIVPSWTDDLDQWQEKVIPLANYGGLPNVQFRIRGVRGNDFYSDMAIDDITVISLLPDNAAMQSIDSPTLPTCSFGSTSTDVTVYNNGNNAINTLTLNWAVNGVVQTPVVYTTPIPVASSAQISLGTFAYAANDVLEVWTSLPNGNADTQPADDTLSVTLATGLSGNYTIDASQPTGGTNFASFGEAVGAIDQLGLCGSVVFNVAPGTYSEAIALVNFPSDMNNTVSFIGAGVGQTTLVHNQGSGINPTVTMARASYVSFKHMTIENTGLSTYAMAVHISDSSSHITIDSCLLQLDESYTGTSFGLLASNAPTTTVGNTQSQVDHLTVSNTEIRGGYYAVRLSGPTATTTFSKHNRFINNTLSEYWIYGYYVDDQDSMMIMNNVINDSRSPSSGYGIYALDMMHHNFQQNWIKGAETYGIYISDGNFDVTPTARGIIANNMIAARNAGDALYVTDLVDTDIFHNTFSAETDRTVYMTGFSGLSIKNNIFANLGGDFVLETAISFGASDEVDNNLYYRSDGGSLVDIGPNVYADLSAWRVGEPTLNLQSVEGDPIFADPAIGDLHLIGGFANDAADNATFVNVDIDGESRPAAGSTVKDIGADEYSPLANDALVTQVFFPSGCGSATDTVRVAVQNLGVNTVTSLPIEVRVTGDITASLSLNASVNIPFLGQDTITVGTINTLSGGNFTVTAYTDLRTDGNNDNDTTSVLGKRLGLDAVIANSCGGPEGMITASPINPLGLGGGLTTSFASNNGAGGNMFDVDIAPASVTITGFEVNLGTGSGVDLYVKSGTFVGSENNSSAWTFVGTFPVVAAGNDNPTIVTLNTPLVLPQGRHAFFIASASGSSWRYINGGSVGTVWAQNNEITIYEGVGRSDNTFSGSIFTTRNFSGSILYQAGQMQYTWSTGDTTETIMNLTPGTYSVVAVDGVGCSIADTFTVASGRTLTGTIANVSCSGLSDGSITVSITDAGTDSIAYVWSSGDSTQNLNGIDVGTYVLTATGNSGCVLVDTFTIGSDAFTANIGSLTGVSCFGLSDGAITVNASIPNLNVQWSTGDTTLSLSGLSAGTYSAILSDGTGCADSTTLANVVITQPDSLVTTLATAIAGCDSITVSANVLGGTAGYTYSWNDGSTNASLTATSNGTYDVVVSDANGCTDTASANVTLAETLAASTSVVAADTLGAGVGEAQVTVTGGTAPFSYSWSNGDTSATATGLLGGIPYTVTITDAAGCTTTETVTVPFPTNTHNLSNVGEVAIFPNPTQGNVTFNITLNADTELNIQVTTVTGQLIANYNYNGQRQIQQAFDASQLPAGVYLVRFQAGTDLITKRLVVSK